VLAENNCSILFGAWNGNWNNGPTLLPAQIYFTSIFNQNYQGYFILKENSKGTIGCTCKRKNSQTAVLSFLPDPPFYNPCYGILYNKTELYIWCINPYQFGLFIKKGTTKGAFNY